MRVFLVSIVTVAVVVVALLCWAESKGKMWDLVVDDLAKVMISFTERLEKALELEGEEKNRAVRKLALLTLEDLRPIKMQMEEILAGSPTARNVYGMLAAGEMEKAMLLEIAWSDYKDKGETKKAAIALKTAQSCAANATDLAKAFIEEE